MCVLARFEPKR